MPFIFLFSCGIDRDIPSISQKDLKAIQNFEQLDKANKVLINEDKGSAEPLILCLTFVDLASKEPLFNQRVHFYHADATGEYRPSTSGDESTARLSGEAITDSLGRILLKTSLPGDYGSSADNRHIHTTVFGAKPEAYDIHFKQYTGWMGRNFIDGSDQHFLADLKKDESDNLIAVLAIEVKFNLQ